MKKKIFNIFVMTIIVGLMFTTASCQGIVDAIFGELDDPAATVTHISGITILGYTSDSGNTATTTIFVGTELELSVAVSPADTEEVEVIWKSDDETVLTVTVDGLITAVGMGQAVVTVTSKVAPSISATLTVNVVNNSLNINPDPVDQSKADTRD